MAVGADVEAWHGGEVCTIVPCADVVDFGHGWDGRRLGNAFGQFGALSFSDADGVANSETANGGGAITLRHWELAVWHARPAGGEHWDGGTRSLTR